MTSWSVIGRRLALEPGPDEVADAARLAEQVQDAVVELDLGEEVAGDTSSSS